MFEVTQGTAIQCIYLRQTDSVNLVFAHEEGRDKAKMHPRWLATAISEARMRGKQRCSAECDVVAKNTVMGPDKTDRRTLQSAVLIEFKEQNSTKDTDCAVTKTNWLSKIGLKKRTESLVIWFRHKAAADHREHFAAGLRNWTIRTCATTAMLRSMMCTRARTTG